MSKTAVEIVCDACKKEIGGEFKIQTKVIAKDENGNGVYERFFECPHCGEHYTVALMNKEMQLIIQRRKQLRRHAGWIRKGCNWMDMEKIRKEDAMLKRKLVREEKKLRAKYLEGGSE